jgi:hypothetical protein
MLWDLMSLDMPSDSSRIGDGPRRRFATNLGRLLETTFIAPADADMA